MIAQDGGRAGRCNRTLERVAHGFGLALVGDAADDFARGNQRRAGQRKGLGGDSIE